MPSEEADVRKLRELRDLAYERELTTELKALEAAFDQWKENHIDSRELNELIHDFHRGPRRRLASIYEDLEPALAVARAVAYGVLAYDEVPVHLLDELEAPIQFFQDRAQP